MKLLTYLRDGAVRHGRLLGDDRVEEFGDGDLTVWLADPATKPGGAAHDLAGVRVLAPIPRPGKLIGVAANYQEHVTEAGAAPLDRSRLAPRLFLMPPTAVLAPGDAIRLPSVSDQVDWEAELGVVIGRTAKGLKVDDALSAVAGYTVANDVSARSMAYGYERDTGDPAVGFFDWLAGKWLDGFAPFGPYLVTADEVPDPQALDIELRVNGAVKQRGSTKDMIFTVAELVAFAANLMTLHPGDVLMTGTPAGVGASSGEFLSAGDEIHVSIAGLGSLINSVSPRETP
ncbi:fumarylacetoacetate hydrolase family protein [Rhizohabitans arisaemae]|uniref:fumarylacetoacetate hydrolase family protein n=1 Tax=Rhizohabitans arisaemae TaxID=2720610 RepID=UPI0024B12A55|nr:fumarylacetoacetate hydrolase family protein [Rhizohabitans arisaemae]